MPKTNKMLLHIAPESRFSYITFLSLSVQISDMSHSIAAKVLSPSPTSSSTPPSPPPPPPSICRPLDVLVRKDVADIETGEVLPKLNFNVSFIQNLFCLLVKLVPPPKTLIEMDTHQA